MRKLAYLVLTFSLSVGAYAAPLLSENFESATIGFYSTPGAVITGTAFSLVSGSIDVDGAGPGNYGWLCVSPAASQCVDTTGSTASTPGRGVFQTTNALNLAPGSYALSFSLVRWNDTVNGGGPQDATILVTLGALYSETFVVNSGFVNQQVTRTINVGSSTAANLRFTDQSGTAAFAGAIVDNISVNAVPEPMTFGLLGLGLAAMLCARRARLRS